MCSPQQQQKHECTNNTLDWRMIDHWLVINNLGLLYLREQVS